MTPITLLSNTWALCLGVVSPLDFDWEWEALRECSVSSTSPLNLTALHIASQDAICFFLSPNPNSTQYHNTQQHTIATATATSNILPAEKDPNQQNHEAKFNKRTAQPEKANNTQTETDRAQSETAYNG